jgi:phosphoribosyl 1,2-cyclic phosphodiesterase
MLLSLPKRSTSENDFLITVLASGSAGNCTLVRDGERAYFLDLGLPARRILESAHRLGIYLEHPRIRAPFDGTERGPAVRAHAALLTHTHDDHVQAAALGLLPQNAMTLYAHRTHVKPLSNHKYFTAVEEQGRLQLFSAAPFQLSAETFAHPIRLSHDSQETFGFVFFHRAPHGREYKFTYLADLGHYDSDIVEAAADSDVLALEFNHDEKMELQSGRSPATIDRVLGPYGHLSNKQAAALLRKILRSSHRKRRPHTLILLHLSRECNVPSLALEEARRVVAHDSPETQILVARQDAPLAPVSLVRENGRA